MASFPVIFRNAEIRGTERMTNKKGGSYLLVRFDYPENPTGETVDLIDHKLEHEKDYIKGTCGDVEMLCTTGRFKSFEIVRFIPREEES